MILLALTLSALAIVQLAWLPQPVVLAAEKPNVLFLVVDDLRPQLGCYGQKQMVSPNIDRLASQGVLFERAFCMVPTCGASRASLMSGIRPARDRFVNYMARADQDVPGATTLNTHFKNHGYYTVSNGKVFHYPQDNGYGWSEPAWRPKGGTQYALPESVATAQDNAKRSKGGRGPAWESADVPDNTYGDGLVAEKTIADLKRLKELNQPFFLAAGFFKPHLPFVAPKKYWDLYDRAKIHLPQNYHRPKDAPDIAIHNSGELRAYAGIPPKGPVSDETALNLIHGYYACVSYTDAQIGKVLDELDRLGLADDTIVILWADHGWNLGEHTLWCKHCTFETSMHAPLVIRVPGIQGGRRTRGLTEFIDIYPSLSELAGLPLPAHLQGTSFVPLLTDPDKPWKKTAIGRYGPGDTVRTDTQRFTEYTDNRGNPTARMLYDHALDPDENVNIAEVPENRQAVDQLTEQLHAGMGKPAKK
jgi:arylsulfatase A-like enzyme